MYAYLMHTDPEVYASPGEFVPDRWLQASTTAMRRNFVPFSRGSRNCLGQNLAMAEMSLALAVLYRPGSPRLELMGTEDTNVERVPKSSTKDVRVVVR
ncbi:hypothetical protein PG990_008380 [Apiospora arundinis]